MATIFIFQPQHVICTMYHALRTIYYVICTRYYVLSNMYYAPCALYTVLANCCIWTTVVTMWVEINAYSWLLDSRNTCVSNLRLCFDRGKAPYVGSECSSCRSYELCFRVHTRRPEHVWRSVRHPSVRHMEVSYEHRTECAFRSDDSRHASVAGCNWGVVRVLGAQVEERLRSLPFLVFQLRGI